MRKEMQDKGGELKKKITLNEFFLGLDEFHP